MARENPFTWDRRVHLLTTAYRSTPHGSTGFRPNFMVFGKEMYMPVDVMMGCPDRFAKREELEYVQGLRNRLKGAYDVAREHLAGRRGTMMLGLMRVLMNQGIWCGQ